MSERLIQYLGQEKDKTLFKLEEIEGYKRNIRQDRRIISTLGHEMIHSHPPLDFYQLEIKR